MNRPRVPGRPGPFRGAPPPAPRGRPGRPGTPFRPEVARTNPLPIILGVAGVLFIVLLFVLMSGKDEKPSVKEIAAPPPPPAAPRPVDVSGLEREGHKLCDEGLALIRSLEPQFSKDLTEAERTELKENLKKGMDLIGKGMGMLSEANEKSGRTYNTTSYGEARKAASMKYHELK